MALADASGVEFRWPNSKQFFISMIAAGCAVTPALAASRWKPVQPASSAVEASTPVLLSSLNLKGRGYALFRDPKSRSHFFVVRGQREIVDEAKARNIRSEMIGAAWKLQYLAKLSKRPLGRCRAAAAEVVVPATDDRVRVCAGDTARLRDIHALAAVLDRRFHPSLARR